MYPETGEREEKIMAKTKVIIKKVKEGAYKGKYVVPLSNGDYLLETGEVLCKKNNLDISNTRNVPKELKLFPQGLMLQKETKRNSFLI